MDDADRMDMSATRMELNDPDLYFVVANPKVGEGMVVEAETMTIPDDSPVFYGIQFEAVLPIDYPEGESRPITFLLEEGRVKSLLYALKMTVPNGLGEIKWS